jgi:hypothetical protein
MNQEEQQYAESSYPPSSGMMNFDSKADLLDKIRPEEIIEQIKQRLMGKEWDSNKERWVENIGLKNISLTEIGASAITNLIFPASTRNVSISNLKDEEIKKRLLSLIKTAMKMCLDNWEEYGINSVSQLYFVKEIVFTNTLVALKQPENEGIRRLLNSVISENRNVSTYGEEKKGIMGLIRKR